MADSPPPDVILLRSADEPDPYLRAFAEAGLRAECRPVLRFAFPAEQPLRERLRGRDQYAALVATSPRAVRALRRAFDAEPTLRRAWDGARAYAVGPKTGRRLRALGFDVRGEEAGDAEALVSIIVEDGPSAPLLFLSGNRRRETLPDGLRAGEVPFEELVVYETHLRTSLSLPERSGTWLVFFSPSGLEAVRKGADRPLGAFRCAAIGPTTAEALREAGATVEAVADQPAPEALVRAVTQASGDDAPDR